MQASIKVCVASSEVLIRLFQEAELRLVKFLPAILELQMDLVKKFQNVPDLVFTTIKDFLKDQKSGVV